MEPQKPSPAIVIDTEVPYFKPKRYDNSACPDMMYKDMFHTVNPAISREAKDTPNVLLNKNIATIGSLLRSAIPLLYTMILPYQFPEDFKNVDVENYILGDEGSLCEAKISFLWCEMMMPTLTGSCQMKRPCVSELTTVLKACVGIYHAYDVIGPGGQYNSLIPNIPPSIVNAFYDVLRVLKEEGTGGEPDTTVIDKYFDSTSGDNPEKCWRFDTEWERYYGVKGLKDNPPPSTGLCNLEYVKKIKVWNEQNKTDFEVKTAAYDKDLALYELSMQIYPTLYTVGVASLSFIILIMIPTKTDGHKLGGNTNPARRSIFAEFRDARAFGRMYTFITVTPVYIYLTVLVQGCVLVGSHFNAYKAEREQAYPYQYLLHILEWYIIYTMFSTMMIFYRPMKIKGSTFISRPVISNTGKIITFAFTVFLAGTHIYTYV
jgi:hypothetical protein